MKRIIYMLLFVLATTNIMAQGVVKGLILDKTQSTPLEFVNVLVVAKSDTTKIIGSAISDAAGKFAVRNLPDGNYLVKLSFLGYKPLNRAFAITQANRTVSYAVLYMAEDAHMLKEVKITGQRSAMKLEVDRKSFDVSQLVSNAGQAASDVLDNIPSVDVDNDGNICYAATKA